MWQRIISPPPPPLLNLMTFLRFVYTLLSLIERRLCIERIKTIIVKIRMIPNQRMLAPMIPRWFFDDVSTSENSFTLQVKYIVPPRKRSQKLIIAHERRFPSMILRLLVLDAVDSGSKTIFAKTMICACKILWRISGYPIFPPPNPVIVQSSFCMSKGHYFEPHIHIRE